MRKLLASAILALAVVGFAPSVALADPPAAYLCGTTYEDGEVVGNSQGLWQCLLPPGATIGIWLHIAGGEESNYNYGHTFIGSGIGCTWNESFIESDYFGAPANTALSLVYWRQYTSGCGPNSVSQPAGEIRVRDVIQRSGATCVDTGWKYNASSSVNAFTHPNMGLVPDCGSGYYRSVGYGQVWQSGAWRGGSWTTANIWMQ